MRFDMICQANGIAHRLTKPNHSWTRGQVERMNRTIKDATVKLFHYESPTNYEHTLSISSQSQTSPQTNDPERLHALRIHL